MNMTFDELIQNVKLWADDKGILSPDNASKQMMKVIEELGETAGAIAKNKKTEEIQDGIGDTFVTLIILAYQLGLEPSECLERAWNEIKDRKGKTQNGIFVKDEQHD
jgi:NTP pyrophosphatase (non-canonical NTP hydrolase)